MSSKYHAFLLASAAAATLAGAGPAASEEKQMTATTHAEHAAHSAEAAALIPREDLFGNPTRAAGRLSPDGKWLSWLAPKDGVLNVFVAPVADITAAKAVTDE